MKTKDLVYIAMYAALAIALDFVKEMIPFINMPNGGSLNIPLIPIVLASFHLGYKKGFIAAFIWWLVGFMMGSNNFFINPIQYLLDYLIPYFVMSFAGILYKDKSIIRMEIGIVVTMLINTLSVVLSGVYFWPPSGQAAGSLPAWIFSLNYNLPYSLATMVMLMILIPLFIKLLRIDDLRFKKY